MTREGTATSSASSAEELYRLYLDESGDHVFKRLEEPAHRYLCLVGCWFKGRDYQRFHDDLAAFKRQHVPHHPDDPVVLHREDIINRRHAFWRLRDAKAAQAFDRGLLEVVAQTEFRLVAVVIDKKALTDYPTPAHPYHLALGFMLQRYCGFLNHVNRRGDVLAESRGGTEDRRLRDSYAWHYQRGAWMTPASFFQQALTSRELKLKLKSANIAGLQLADLLGHPVRQLILVELGHLQGPLAPSASKLIEAIAAKWNRHLYDGRVEGYGKVFYPK